MSDLSPTGKSLLIFRNRVKPRNQKYFGFRLTQIRCISKPSRPDRGAFRDRHGRWAGDAVDAAARETSGACWRTAKSCRSGAPMPASSLREEAQATVSNKPGHRGEREVSRKTIARGMPGETGVTVVTNSCVCFFTHEAAGASCARHSLRPLNFRRRNVLGKRRAGRAARSRTYVSRHCEERSDEAIHSFFAWLHGLLRGACHRARIRATRWLAMTRNTRREREAMSTKEQPLDARQPSDTPPQLAEMT